MKKTVFVKNLLIKVSAVALAFAPSFAFAFEECVQSTDLVSLFKYAGCLLIGYVTPFLFSLAGVIFLIGVLRYVSAGDNEEKRTAGRDLMWFGIVALFVMLCVWGFVNILSKSIFNSDYGQNLPNLPKQADTVFKST